MAIERQAPAATAAKRVTKAAAKPASSKSERPAPAKGKPAPAAGRVAQLREELATARREHALEKLDKPHRIRRLRRDLARALTAERAHQDKEAT